MATDTRTDGKLTDKKILIFGSGVSGIGAAKLLEEAGETPLLYDGNDRLEKEKNKRKAS